MFLRERQCLFGRDNVCSGETICFRERQGVFRRDNVSSGNTMCVPETQCVFRRHNVCSGDTMWPPDTGCPGQKMTSRLSPDLFPASIRIKMMREIRWYRQKCPEYLKNHENPPQFFFSKFFFQNFWKKIRRCRIEN